MASSSSPSVFHSEGLLLCCSPLQTSTAEFMVKTVNLSEKNIAVELCIFDIPGQAIFDDMSMAFVRPL